MMDEWTEYLCVRPQQGGVGWEIAICGIDEDEQLLPIADNAVEQFDSLSEQEINAAILSLGWSKPEEPASISACCQNLARH